MSYVEKSVRSFPRQNDDHYRRERREGRPSRRDVERERRYDDSSDYRTYVELKRGSLVVSRRDCEGYGGVRRRKRA
jgi:hypothetical protein